VSVTLRKQDSMQATLISKTDVAKDTISFQFSIPDLTTFTPGQYCILTLPLYYPDNRGEKRQFTISSTPQELPVLTITTRVSSSGFKKSLLLLPLGSNVYIDGPFGVFSFDTEDEKFPHVFIAGGMGITPFRSMIGDIIQKNKTYSITLIYSNSVPEQIAFYDELKIIDKQYPYINVWMTVTRPSKLVDTYTEHIGRIDETLFNILSLRDEKFTKSIFWVCGSPKMVNSIENLLVRQLISDSVIRSEKFTGY
jgi:ferredoxin-NADP reductase